MFFQRLRQARVALAEKAEIDRQFFHGLVHAFDIPRAGCAGGCVGASGRTGAAADHGGDAGHQRFVDLLRTNKMNVRVDGPGGCDQTFPRNHFGARADNNCHARLHVGIARLADGRDASGLDADVRFDDAPVIDDQRIGDHGVDSFF